jgi:hypothetical protein
VLGILVAAVAFRAFGEVEEAESSPPSSARIRRR